MNSTKCPTLAERIVLLVDSAEMLSKSRELDLAERVGDFERDFAKANEINGFAIISCNREDLAVASIRRRLRPFAGSCRFFYCNGTRNDTRRRPLRRVSRQISTLLVRRTPSSAAEWWIGGISIAVRLCNARRSSRAEPRHDCLKRHAGPAQPLHGPLDGLANKKGQVGSQLTMAHVPRSIGTFQM